MLAEDSRQTISLPKNKNLVSRPRSVVLHNLPSARHTLEYQRKEAMRMLPRRHGQSPAAGNNSSAPGQQINGQVLKFQVTHFISALLVVLAISLQCGLPAFGDI